MSQLLDERSGFTTAAVCVWFVSAAALWYVVSSFAAWRRLRQVPGPFVASFSCFWLADKHIRGHVAPAFRDLSKYGSVVRIAPNTVVTDDPEVLRRLSGVRNGYTRHESYRGAKTHPTQDSMLTILDDKAHDIIKAKTAAGYSGRENPDFVTAVDSQLLRLIELIRRKHLTVGEKTNVVDFAPLSRFFTLDTITRLAYGEAFGHLDEGTDKYGYVGDVDKALKAVAIIRSMPLIRALFFSPPMLKMMGPKATDPKGLGKMMAVTYDMIDKRLRPNAKLRQDMMGVFVRNGMTREECEAEAMLQIVAGSDTTATTIRGTMFCLLTAPRAYRNLKEEIKGSIERNEVSQPITMDEAKRLPYLQSVIWEGFRYKNPLTYGHFKVVPPGGDTLNGVFVPGGTAIGHNSLALTQNTSIFGPDVDIFRPERFLDASETKRNEMIKSLDIVFGGGRWTCAGKAVAMMELNKTFFEASSVSHRPMRTDADCFQLMRAFDFQFVNPEKPWEEETNITFSHKNMFMRITEAEW